MHRLGVALAQTFSGDRRLADTTDGGGACSPSGQRPETLWNPGGMVVVLLALRFALELALVAAIGVLGTRLPATPLGSAALALGMVVATVVTWGVLLSPRRRIDLPLPVRVGVELGLFGVGAVGLAWSGSATWGWVLISGEVVVLVALWSLGLPPGSDAARHRTATGRP